MKMNLNFEKYITHKGKNVFKLLKTKTNKYYLLDMDNHILAYGKNNILRKIKKIMEALKMDKKIRFVVYNRNTGKKDNKQYNTLQEAINEACRKNDKINSYNFLVTSIKQ